MQLWTWTPIAIDISIAHVTKNISLKFHENLFINGWDIRVKRFDLGAFVTLTLQPMTSYSCIDKSLWPRLKKIGWKTMKTYTFQKLTFWPWPPRSCDLEPKNLQINQEHLWPNVFCSSFMKIYWHMTEIFESRDLDLLASCDLDLRWNDVILTHSRLHLSTNLSTKFPKNPFINSREKRADTFCTRQTGPLMDAALRALWGRFATWLT